MIRDRKNPYTSAFTSRFTCRSFVFGLSGVRRDGDFGFTKLHSGVSVNSHNRVNTIFPMLRYNTERFLTIFRVMSFFMFQMKVNLYEKCLKNCFVGQEIFKYYLLGMIQSDYDNAIIKYQIMSEWILNVIIFVIDNVKAVNS
ncbi:hypothetical protein Phum_PHUM395950 [Pediculus humanus corporis]|uniref:Uncharacterized protein n=1 Tax=Pediculus humanus subsp. corporis TaxID=121224 RepID=E0VRB1_PEDHC|nr:uncharacterized protein Phum_PHUM395950 [Pediculus humanus corporis]EEB15917.1 hypothetical protein Phum_PHUM395950 [Pediculus humanus corporis]